MTNSFGMLAKQDTSHGFPVARPLERNSDWALYNVNSEGWFQCWSLISGICMVSFWFWIACMHFSINTQSCDDEDDLRYKDAKASTIWERCFWSFTYQLHGQHMAALQREVKFYASHPDDAKLCAKTSYNNKNPYAPDRYYKGWGNMMDMRML